MDYAPYYLTGTGNVGPAIGGRVMSIVITGGADAASVTLRKNGSGGSVFAVFKAALGTTVTHMFAGAAYEGQLHATVTGTTPDITIEIG